MKKIVTGRLKCNNFKYNIEGTSLVFLILRSGKWIEFKFWYSASSELKLTSIIGIRQTSCNILLNKLIAYAMIIEMSKL